MENQNIVNDELNDMKEDLKIQKYHDRVVNNQLTEQEIKARKNMEKVMTMPMEDFLKGNFDNIQ